MKINSLKLKILKNLHKLESKVNGVSVRDVVARVEDFVRMCIREKAWRRALLVFAGLLFLSLGIERWQLSNSVAVVNNEKIDAREYENLVAQEEHLNDFENVHMDESLTRERVMREMIEQALVRKYAEGNGIRVTDRALEEHFTASVESVGSREEYMERVQKVRGVESEAAIIEIVRYDILEERVREHMDESFEGWLERARDEADVNILIEKY